MSGTTRVKGNDYVRSCRPNITEANIKQERNTEGLYSLYPLRKAVNDNTWTKALWALSAW